MQCPVCGAEAEDLSSGDFDGLVVGCKRCGDYAVGEPALNAFLRLDFDDRVSLLEGAKSAAGQGSRPVIASV